MMKSSVTALVLFLATMELILAYGPRSTDILQSLPRRDLKPNWGDLGWAWGKRSQPEAMYPRRFLRSMQLVKKTPDWHDLGWAWGRRK